MQSNCRRSIFNTKEKNTMPPPVVTNFTCRGREMGFYADLEMNCRVYHNCDDHGNKFTYYCPIDTAFRQEAMVCDHAHLVKCQSVDDNPPDKSDEQLINIRQSFRNSSPTNDRKNAGFSRSFRIGQDYTSANSVKNKNPTFTLNSSVFLRNRSDIVKKSSSSMTSTKNFNFITTKSPAMNFAKKKEFTTTIRPLSSNNRNTNFDFLQAPPKIAEKSIENRNFFINRDEVFPKSKSRPLMFLEPPFINNGVKTTNSYEFTTKLPFNFANNNYPYMETLRSIQRESRTESSFFSTTTKRSVTTKSSPKTVTEIPFTIFTASLKPLIPNEVEYDPYYPKFPTSTEIHYTLKDTNRNIKPSKLSTKKPPTDLHLRIPSILPDLNSLEDLVDRRKIFYIPKSRSN
ncbi:uncharacterized protein LOC127283089 isoform X2 [Leptopilina boulardi]|uniref:uncharacterized protein LOC127283089 isoform X2 n=1 Tax=Leptopilina boulardi TaxID=63433 RepID=UPI0021F65CDA|nr:uncharacterized protein LOC127283089 isoform X2 [Leptopilina boulardi]